ncbi:hypothetical protein DMN91_002886, partial [Ooceraea biroi]
MISKMKQFSSTYLPKKHHRICQAHFAQHMWEKVRCDGKLKLKNNAVPTIFPSYAQLCETMLLDDNNDAHIDNNDENMNEINMAIDHTRKTGVNQQLQLNSINENTIPEVHVNKRANEIPEDHPSDSINENMTLEDHLNERRKENLEKQCENLTNLLKNSEQKYKNLENYMKKQENQFSKIIKTNHKYKTLMKKRFKKLKDDLQTYGKLKTMMSNIFNEDQVKALCNPNKKVIWSPATIQRAIRLKLTCGSSGYHEIMK